MHVSYKIEEGHSYMRGLVEGFLLKTVPGADVENKELLVDRLMTLIINTRQIRLAAAPNPESQVLMRTVVRRAIKVNEPIPVLVPSGPKKPNGGAIDLAELSAVWILSCLDKQIRRYHPPGIKVRIRLEDETGFYLEEGMSEHLERDIRGYTFLFSLLCRIVNDEALHPFEESRISNGRITELARELQPAFEAVLSGQASISALHDLGWKGPLSQSLRDSLDERFLKLFPYMTTAERIRHASKYLANTLARVRVKATGWDPEWAPEGAIEISFAPPSPDSPLATRRVFYRSAMLNHCKLHMPFWRARGFFRNDSAGLRVSLRPFNMPVNLIPGTILLEKDGESIEVNAGVLID
jgi:hypothetical protein